jgi:exodeoxyribonuclease V alpha subunit
MQEAIRLAKEQLPLEHRLLRALPEQAATIHRLLGPRSNSVYFRHHRNNPLPLDVLVVDEASMVDLALMAKLVDALPSRARLILLGDKDQLASVEAGAVLGDVCGEVPGFSGAFGARLRRVTNEQIPVAESAHAPLGNAIVMLRHSYRFGSDSGIGHLARAVNGGRQQQALALLESRQFEDIAWSPADSVDRLYAGMAGWVEAGYQPYLEAVRSGAAAHDVFSAFNRFRVLCAVRGGPASVEALNREIEKILHARGLIDSRRTWYPGRPIMITRNDYNLRLFNGDVGIVRRDPSSHGGLRVFFEAADGGLRHFPPTRLPRHETVYAMTVHKSQGSEFDHVLLALPFEFSRVLTRELLYTGITRARKNLEIWGKPQVFQAAVGHDLRRSSGLRDALWGVRSEE